MRISGNFPPHTIRRPLVDILRQRSAVISFTKKNGERRTMFCTLKQEFLPALDPKKANGTRRKSETALPIFDMEIQQWRSFRLDSLESLTVF